jgi:C1A family cysteine protease
MPHQFSLGWKRQRPDPRDYYHVAPKRVTDNLPAAFDLTVGMGEYFDQGALGSCGPNTSAECIEFDDKAEGLPVVAPSRLFIYYATRSIMGTTTEDSGVDNRSMLKALNQYGFCNEASWPYDISQFTTRPPDSCWAAATQNRIDNYAAVIQSISQIKGTIAGGRPFIFGFDCFQQIMSDEAAATGIISDPAPFDTPIGGHDMTACAFDDNGFGISYFQGKGALKIRQHWTVGGQPWGAGGYGYVSYAYATGQHSSDFWVINAVPTTPQPPGPQPPAPAPPRPWPCHRRELMKDAIRSWIEVEREYQG